jgi:hypothetical protein
MHLKKFIEILKTFDKDELKKFKRFISSDYFNTNKSIVKLFKFIMVFYPEFSIEEKKLRPESLFKRVYSTRKYDEKTFRYLTSSLYSLTEQFLAHSTFEKSKLEVKKAVIHNLIGRRLHSHAVKNLTAAETELDKESLLSSAYIFNKMDYRLLWHQLYFLSNMQDPLIEKRLEQGEYFFYNSIVELSHLFQIIYKISFNFNLPVRENLVFEFLKSFDHKRMLTYIEANERAEFLTADMKKIYKTLKIYLCFMETMTNAKDELHFNKMNSLIYEHAALFDRKEQQNLYLMLATVCTEKRKNLDDKKYQKKYFEIIKSGVSKDLYISYASQYMDYTNFLIILDTALQLGENNWAEKFREKYIEHISPEYSGDINNYADSELFFAKKEYESSMNSLSKVKAKLLRLKAPVRALKLRLYYELGYFDKAFLLIDSYIKFLNSSKNIREDEKNSHFKFLEFYKVILKTKADDPENINRNFMQELEAAALLQHKTWLIEKAVILKLK